MITALAIAGGFIWGAVAVLGCIALGMCIADADRREVGPASCCPHPESEAPETVRGQFRAVVVRP